MPYDSKPSASRTVAEIFGWDHRRLDVLLADPKRSLAAGELAGAATLFSQFREGLGRHIVVEEEILYPTMDRAAAEAGRLDALVGRIEL